MTNRGTIVLCASAMLASGAALLFVGCSDSDVAPATSTSATTTDSGHEPTADGGNEPPADADAGEVDAFLAACARVDACATDDSERIGLNACYSVMQLHAWRSVLGNADRVMMAAFDCKMAAADCDAVRACEPELTAFADFCKEKEYGDHCSGDTWVVCDDGTSEPTAAVDCAAAGLVCGEQFGAGCGLSLCEFGATKSSCDGDTLVECSAAGVVVRTDCKVESSLVILTNSDHEDILYTMAGEVCGVDNKDFKGEYKCVGTGEACDHFEQRCDGTVLETCTGGWISRRDCGALEPEGMSCGFIPSGSLAGALSCGPLDTPCDAADDESCADGTLSFCALTHPETVDCRQLGYSGCGTAARDGRTVGFCVP